MVVGSSKTVMTDCGIVSVPLPVLHRDLQSLFFSKSRVSLPARIAYRVPQLKEYDPERI